MFRRHTARQSQLAVTLAALAGAAAVVTTSPAQAQTAAPEPFDVQLLHSTPDQWDGGFSTQDSQDVGAGYFQAGFLLHYGHQPLKFKDSDDKEYDLVGGQLASDFHVVFGLVEALDIGVTIPVVLLQSGDDARGARTAGLGDYSKGELSVDDFTVTPRITLIQNKGAGLGVALSGDLTMATGDKASFRSDGEFRGGARLAVDYGFEGGTKLLFNAGYAWRPEARFVNLLVEDQAEFSVAALVPLKPQLALIPEVQMASVMDGDASGNTVPVELRLGTRYSAADWLSVTGGLGTAASGGYGAPVVRIFGGLAVQGHASKDDDNDFILNEKDACPDQPEDTDEFQDSDGCPDPDNDGDGVLDKDDRKPNDAEDKDGFQDTDGAPDPDNDDDGVLDADDQCPAEAEDKDGFEDTNGCADPDNDGDGILDKDDRKPDEAEDKDGFQDTDGAPDPDNDRDGLLDGADRCVDQPETFNGVDDGDGCPDQGGKILVTCEKVNISEQVFFESGKDVIQSRSLPMLDQLAAVLNAAQHIRKMSINGYTDDRGDAAANQTLSANRAAAVVRYLVSKGVSESRLTSAGFGEADPIASNATSEGRAANRRVEFKIIEQDSNCTP